MGLRGWLLRRAALCPRVLVVGVPYGTRARLLVEAEVARRGWPVASSPAEASLVVVCGQPGPELAEAVREVWESVTAPRDLLELPPDVSQDGVADALDGAVRELGDEQAQWRDAQRRAGQGTEPPPHGGREHRMEMPGGVAMAQRGADRDGLKLDRLHVPLGPVLVDWPAGLVVDTVLQGDVIQRAVVRVVGADGTRFREPYGGMGPEEARRRAAAARLDSLGRMLGVAGWPGAAREARRLRDRLLAGADGNEVARHCARFARRVRRSRVLRWMLRGLGTIGADGPERLRGDALDRLYRWIDEVGDLVPTGGAEDRRSGGVDAAGRAKGLRPRETDGTCGGEGRRFGGGGGTCEDEGRRFGGADGAGGVDASGGEVVLGVLPGLLAGAELAVARLIVASLDPDLDQAAAPAEAPDEWGRGFGG